MPILARTPLEMTSSVSLKKFRSFYAIDVHRASSVILRAADRGNSWIVGASES